MTAILVLACGGGNACAAESTPAARLTVEGLMAPQPERYLVGQWVTLYARLENLTDEPIKLTSLAQDAIKVHVEGALRRDCVSQLMSLGYLVPATLEAHARVFVPFEVSARGAVEPGAYEVWAEYDATAAPDHYLVDEGIPRLQLRSDRLRFEIVQPSGVDAVVLGELGDSCHRVFLVPGRTEEILQRFPDSSYAGWAMRWAMEGLPAPSDPMDVMLPAHWDRAYPKKLPDDPAATEHWVEEYGKAREAARREITRRQSYLERNPSFIEADRMRLAIAYLYLEAGNVAEGRRTLGELTAKSDLPRWIREQATAATAYIKEREAAPGGARLPEGEAR